MRTRRLLLAMLVALGLLAAACSDSDDDGGAVSSGDGSTTTEASGEAAGKPIKFVPLDPGAVTFEALDNGDVDMALLFSTQGIIAEKGWVVLDDDMTLQGSDNIVPLVRKDKADDTVTSILNEVSAKLTTAGLTELNRRVDSDKEDTEVVAKDFLTEAGLLEGEAATGGGKITVGSAAFSEAEIVAQMYKLALQHAGYDVTLKAQLGSREVLYPALTSGEIDVEPDYVQSLLAYLDKEAKPVTPDEGVQAITAKLDPALIVLDPSPAQDQNAIVVTKATADKYGLTKVSDLKKVTDQLKMAGPPECPERPLCIPGYEGVYGLQFDV
jgi:osmoprotectant transport system substrate-binding protein